jgi:hypothetical protein
MTDLDAPAGAAALASTAAIRDRAQFLLNRARAGESQWFQVHDDRLAIAADEASCVTTERYPNLQIPFHSRWRHFEAGGVDRKAGLDARLPDDAAERARIQIDLTVVSVLLDAGAGPDWKYREARGPNETGVPLGRSEGLGVASWHAFLAGLFSSDPDRPLRVDAAGLAGLTAPALADAFQVGPKNPLVGLDGRLLLLRRLSAALAAEPGVFGTPARPGGLFDVLTDSGSRTSISAHDILTALLANLSGIWPSGNVIGDVAVGDCWHHPAVRGAGLTAGWMPFHKLSQWLTYSLLEPFSWAGIEVTGLDDLTGLPEYRNGGLFLDTGVLSLRRPDWLTQTWSVGSELVVEWRALTVALLDELAPLVRERLGVDACAMPLARVLEGGTWAAGRATAQRLRGGLPPFIIASDGTVF